MHYDAYPYSIMLRSFHVFAYKIRNYQKITPAAINARETFTNATLQQLNAGEIDIGSIWLSDEAYFFPKRQRQ